MSTATSTIVGALACQKNSFLKTLNTKVVSSYEFASPLPSSKENGKKSSSSIDKEKLKYGVELEDTILFPEGGGQPFDKGTITILNDSEKCTIEVKSILRDKLKAVHIVEEPIKQGTLVQLNLDWDRRVDIMQQHTGQHLLSAVFDTYKMETLSWSMGDQINYIELPKKIDDSIVEEVQNKVNQLIFEAHPIEVVTLEGEAGTEKGTETKTGTGVDLDTSHLPQDYDQDKGIIRIVKIGDLDSNPCCGTHLSNTSQIQSIVLLNQTSIRGGHSRLYFTCGSRVTKLTSDYYDILKTISGLQLSCSIDNVVAKVDQLNSNYRKANSTINALNKELANIKATEIFKKFKYNKASVAYVYRDDSSNPEFFAHLSKELMTMINADKSSGVDIANTHTLVLLNGQTSTGGMLKITGPKATEISTELKSRIGTLKGGGKGSSYQGKVTKYEKGEIESVIVYLDSIL
ncbi:hypothetical protein KGF56_004189 [Candida oxycetoniae]|uniref:Alanyl-transfer RNA synthetases family profile domain-containing protein n=1 Tax=Candida oxycetoniae TaxID=497107 RepID=A0AAI9STT8_9ASCO|nr:uncharacterized protein KGF56_004189 [Candida oxycetoniae]KAI3402937.2 hypothetical protein KGF56_004189 [Candida oxycetoniae]